MLLHAAAFFVFLSVASSQPGPTPLSPHSANVMMIGDSISMGYFGYSLFVQDMLQLQPDRLVGSVQHGGGFGSGGQMRNSRNGVSKVTACIGNTTGSLKPKAWSVITYNAGLHDCANDSEFVPPAEYAVNLRAIFETLKPAAHAVAFVTTTPFDLPTPPGMDPNMSCVLQRNKIARQVAQEVGGISIDDLHQYVEDFCDVPQNTRIPAGRPDAGNYTKCAVQTTGEHFYTVAPLPSGQQYTALSIANTMARNLPADQLAPPASSLQQPYQGPTPLKIAVAGASCGLSPKPLNQSVPNVLIIGDSISMTGSGYGPAVRHILESPIRSSQGPSGALAAVQHAGGWTGEPGANEQGGSSSNGRACAKTWIGDGGWDVITMNFGLHDCWAPQKVDEAAYVANLAAVYAVASAGLAVGGKVIWVQTTPTSTNNTFRIENSCVKKHNDLAAELFLNKPDVVIADLYTAVTGVCGQEFSQCSLQKPKDIHFEPAGRQFTAVVTAHAIARELGPKWGLLTSNRSHEPTDEPIVQMLV